jgi:hypothetical protein
MKQSRTGERSPTANARDVCSAVRSTSRRDIKQPSSFWLDYAARKWISVISLSTQPCIRYWARRVIIDLQERVALNVRAALSQFPERSVAHHSGPRYAHEVCTVSPLMNNVITDAVT